MNLTLDTDRIRDWIAEAGDIARHYFKHVNVEWKGLANPVTAADREIEQLITARLREAYPDHGIIGEEFGGDPTAQDYLWTIDPIDGTRAYVEGLPSWSITIALLYRRVPVFGLVYMPLYDDWTYTDGDDVINNGTSIQGCLHTAWKPESYVLARSDAHAEYDIRFTRVMTMGSTASHMAYTARGASVATLVHDSYCWDIAAGAAIITKLGGEIRFLSGEALDFRTLDLTACINGMYIAGHPDVVRRLLPLITPRNAPRTHPDW
ncbi:MAG: inositol monophosphatase [Anaerolineae bacterium]|nr:inositol monophosphatase [Anaerolineae bacterium]